MEFTDYVRIFGKRWWIFVVAVVVTAGSAYLFSEVQHPEYTSTAEIIIEPARPDWGLTQSSKMLLRTYMTVIDSRQTAQLVIDELQISYVPEELLGMAYFAAEDDRMVIKLEIKASDGEVANRIAKAWAQQLIYWRDEQNAKQRKEDRVYAYLRDEPRYDMTWPRTKVITAAGSVFGLVIAGVVTFFLEWIEAGIIRTPRDLERQLNLVVVGTIPD